MTRKMPDHTGRLGRWKCKQCEQEWPEHTTYHAMKARIRAEEIHPGNQCEPGGHSRDECHCKCPEGMGPVCNGECH